MISESDRRQTIELIETAREAGARLMPTCQVLAISVRTFQRWTKTGSIAKDRRSEAVRPPPANKLTSEEKQSVLDICHQKENASLPPSQIVPKLADQGEYVASESSFYRILHEANEQHHRSRSQKPRKSTPPRGFCATGPNQVWTWDITWLPASIRGMFFYLYMIVDVFSRKIVGWEVFDRECSGNAAGFVYKAVWHKDVSLSRLCCILIMVLPKRDPRSMPGSNRWGSWLRSADRESATTTPIRKRFSGHANIVRAIPNPGLKRSKTPAGG